jgi:hypothetical protein
VGLSELQACPSKKKDSKNAAFYARRNKKRAAKQAAEGTKVKQVAKRRRTESTKEPLCVDLSIEVDAWKMVTGPGWIAKRAKDLPQGGLTAGHLIQRDGWGFTYFPWDGRYAHFVDWEQFLKADTKLRSSHLLLDTEKRVIGVLVGQPRGEERWKQVCMGVFEALKTAASSLNLSKEKKKHRRGEFPAVAHGISFGGGQEVSRIRRGWLGPLSALIQAPRHLKHTKENEDILEGLMLNKDVQRVCKFGSRKFWHMMSVQWGS